MKRYSKLAILIILKAAVMIGGLAQAAEPPEEPILRIETGMHTAKNQPNRGGRGRTHIGYRI